MINFSMDFLTLYLSGIISDKKTKKWRLAAGAAVGAFSGTALSIFEELIKTEHVVSLIGTVFISFTMTYIAFGGCGSLLAFFRDSLCVYGLGILGGGIMTYLMSFGKNDRYSGGEVFFTLFAICFAMSVFITRIFKRKRKTSSAQIEFDVNGINEKITALSDSGCIVSEPISSLPVVIVREKSVPETALMIRENVRGVKLRLVPLNGIEGEKLLRGFIPDHIYINKKEVSAVVALAETEKRFGEYDGIVPAALCK